MQRLKDACGQRRSEAGHGGDLLDRRLADALQRPEGGEQRPPSNRPDARDPQQLARDRTHRAALPIVADGGPMRLVPRLLQQPERGGAPRQPKRLAAAT